MKLKPYKDFFFLVDVNLPKRFYYFNSPKFKHVVDINPEMKDYEVWEYAIVNNYVILTKDADFYDRFMSSERFPKIVYFKLGNLSLNQLHLYFEKNWNSIIEYLQTSNFIIAFKESIKVIS